MNEDLGRDIEVTHNILNYLNACYQGHFACLNMLSQLGYQKFNPDDLTVCQENITFVERLLGQLHQGLPVFSMVWKIPQTADSKETLSRVSKLRLELKEISDEIEKLLMEPTLLNENENVKLLIANYTRFAYTNEHYIKGFVDYGKSFTMPEVVASYEGLLDQAEQNISAAHLFFDVFTSEEGAPDVFYTSLFEESLFLPGMFRTNVHDLSKFLYIYKTPLTFEQLEIPPEISEEWKVIKVDPDLAGYWNAFQFAASDMIDWVQAGIRQPRQAWFWNCLHFTPESAAPWIRQGFTPPLAREWLDHEFLQNLLPLCLDFQRNEFIKQS